MSRVIYLYPLNTKDMRQLAGIILTSAVLPGKGHQAGSFFFFTLNTLERLKPN